MPKTDAIDAAVLAKFGSLLAPQTREPVSQTLNEIKELQIARSALVKDRTATLNRQKQWYSPLLKRQAAQRLRRMEAQLKAIEAALHALCAADVALRAKFDILLRIPGVGAPTAVAMLIEMPELGTLGSSRAASRWPRTRRARDRKLDRKTLNP